MKIAHKLILGFIGIALLGAAVAYIALHQLIKIEETFQATIPASLTEIQETSTLNELAQLIGYYDEVLTQSARNYGFTLDEKWEARSTDPTPPWGYRLLFKDVRLPRASDGDDPAGPFHPRALVPSESRSVDNDPK